MSLEPQLRRTTTRPASGGLTGEVAMPAINHMTGVTLAERFGVPRDDTAATDRTTALQAAINNSVGKLLLPPGRILLTGATLVASLRHGLIIEGQGPYNAGSGSEGTELVVNKAAASVIDFQSCIGAGLKNVSIKCATTVPTSGAAVAFTYKSGETFASSNCVMENVRMEHVFNGLDASGVTDLVVDGLKISNVFGTYGVRFRGTASDKRSDVLTIANLVCDNPLSVTSEYAYKGNWAATTAYVVGDMVAANSNIYVCVVAGTSGSTAPSSKGTIASRNVTDGTVTWQFACTNSLAWVEQDNYGYTLNVSHARLINGAYGLRQRDSANTGSSYPVWMRGYDVDCDHSILGGVQAEAGEDLMFTDLWISSVRQGNGVTLGASHRGGLRLINSEANHCGFHGVLIESGPTGNLIQNCQIGNNSRITTATYSGVALASGAGRVQIIGNRFDARPTTTGNDQAYGVLVSAANNDNYVIVGNAGAGNATALIADTTSNATRYVAGNVAG